MCVCVYMAVAVIQQLFFPLSFVSCVRIFIVLLSTCSEFHPYQHVTVSYISIYA